MNFKTLIEICGFVLTGIYLIVTIVINSLERVNISSLPSEIDITAISESTFAVLSNIMSEPVVNLRIIDAENDCSTGTVPTLFTWQSVSKYCQCSNSVSRTSCSRNSACRNESQRTISFYKWKGKKFCLDKLNHEEWKFSQGGSFPCPDGFRLCKGDICVIKNILECPITDIVASETQPSSTEGSFKNISFFTGGKSLFISRDTEKTPLVTMTAGIPSTPCINTRVFPKRSNGSSYPIIEIQPDGCDHSGKYGADTLGHIPMDTDSEWNFHDPNTNGYFNGLPGYRDYVGNEQASLFARKKIEFKANNGVCLTYDYQSLKDVAKDLSTFESLRLGCNISTFLILALGFLIPIIAILGKASRRKSCETTIVLSTLQCCKKNNSGSTILSLGIIFIATSLLNALVLIILCGIAVSYVSAIDSNSVLMNELADSDCFQTEGYNVLFNNLQYYIITGFPSSKSHNTANLIISALYFFLGVVLLILTFVWGCIKSDHHSSKI